MPFWISSVRGGGEIATDKDAAVSYSQFGEDQILWQFLQMFRRTNSGFFVDIGANHPRRYSNTYLLYRYCDWRGINIEPNPDMANLFAEFRPEDQVVNCAIALAEGTTTYFQFNHPGINTIDPVTADKQARHPAYKLVGTTPIRTRPLAAVLRDTVPNGREIDFMSIDVEGMDYDVISSNDWSTYRPKILCLEDHHLRLDNVSTSRSYKLLRHQGYTLESMAVVSAFYVRRD